MPLNIGGNEIVKIRANQIVNTNPVFNNLLLNFDAGIVSSYAGSGTTWTDLSGNGYNATLINGPTYSTSGGGSIAFDGSNDYAEINVNSWIRSTSSAYTFSSFFYLTTSDGGAPYSLLTFPNDGNATDGFWQHLNLGNWLWRTEDNVSGEFGGNVESPTPFSSGNWYHIATVVKTNSLIFYRNGLPVATISTTFNWANLRSDHTAYVYLATGYSPGVGYHLNGKIANFQMYSRELSASEIVQNYQTQKQRIGV
jgi:hypothetical protein